MILTNNNLRVSLYARVSSEQQAEANTIASQVAELRRRIAQDGGVLDEDACFLDDGVSGSTLLRPALKPGGRVAIVDFRPESPVGAPKHFRLSAGQIQSEMTAAGFRPAGSHDFLPYQHFLLFTPVR